MNQQLSSLRAQLLKAQQLLPSLLVDCFNRTAILPGSLYTLRRQCGKPSCCCGRGQLHDTIAAVDKRAHNWSAGTSSCSSWSMNSKPFAANSATRSFKN